jgi:hypothetical protein
MSHTANTVVVRVLPEIAVDDKVFNRTDLKGLGTRKNSNFLTKMDTSRSRKEILLVFEVLR